MTAHRPKTAALLAHVEGLLSEAGERRLAGHLAACAVCRRELAAIEAYDQVLEEARVAPAPAVDFDRMELALRREAKAVAAQIAGAPLQRDVPLAGGQASPAAGRAWVPALVFAAAAAALLGLYLTQPATDEAAAGVRPTQDHDPAQARTTREGDPAPELDPAHLAPVVTLVTGRFERLGAAGEAATSLAVSSLLAEGEHVATGADGEAHVRLAPGTGIVLGPGTELALARARQGEVELALERGAVSQEVAPLAAGARYVVLAGAYRVEVRGTRFVVIRERADAVAVGEEVTEGDRVFVEVAEGRVEVTAPDGSRAMLIAPARWRSDGPVPETPVASDMPAVRAPHALDGLATTPVSLAHPDVVRWELPPAAPGAGGTTIDSAQPVALAMREGEHRVSGWSAQGRRYDALLPVGHAPVALDEGMLVAEPPRLRAGHLETEAIVAVVQRGQRNLTRCYEASLRRGAAPVGRMSLRVTVSPAGDVSRVLVRGLDGPGAPELETCITNYVERWIFPAPGGPVAFDVPLNLAPTMQ